MNQSAVTKCQLCGNKKLKKLFSLGKMPLGFPLPKGKKPTWTSELSYLYCSECHLIQTKYPIPSSKLAKENLYPSDVAKIVQDHDSKFPNILTSELKVNKKDLIVEIGCSDGQLLNSIHKKGFTNLLGIDPALHPSKKYNFEMIQDFFTKKSVTPLVSKGRYPRVIILNYVLELIPPLDTFFADLAYYANETTDIIIEVPSFLLFLNTFRLDGFVHLRCHWFTVLSLVHAFTRHGFGITHLTIDPVYRGGTIRIIGRKGASTSKRIETIKKNWYKKEKALINNLSTASIKKRLNDTKQLLQKRVALNAKHKIPMYAYGAGLKANTIMNLFGLTNKTLIGAVDKDINKQNKYIPKANIPVISFESFKDIASQREVAVVLCANDHSKEVTQNLKNISHKKIYLTYLFPTIKTIVI